MSAKVPDELQEISAESGHKYFHMMLNMADDDLDCREYRLLGHYLRWANHGGTHKEGVRKTAKNCHMGTSSVEKTRDKLVTLGYLKVYKPTEDERKVGVATKVTVIDRWAENITRYKGVPSEIHPVPSQVHLDGKGVPSQVHIEELSKEEPESRTKNKDSYPAHICQQHFIRPLIAALVALPPPKTAHEKRLEGDPLYAMASKVWHTDASGLLNNLTAILRGNSKRTGWAEANIAPAVEPEDLERWVSWYKRETKNASLPMQPVKIQYWFDRFRKTRTHPGLAVDPDKILNLPAEDDPGYWEAVQAELKRVNGIAS